MLIFPSPAGKPGTVRASLTGTSHPERRPPCSAPVLAWLPFACFTIPYLNGRFEILACGKSEADTEWSVSREYLASVADNSQKYIDHPAKLDLDWVQNRAPGAAQSLLKKAS